MEATTKTDNYLVIRGEEGDISFLLAKQKTIIIELGFMISTFLGRQEALIDTQKLTQFLEESVSRENPGRDIGMVLRSY
ncbi:MAG: hypothetical protein AABZ14_05040 [Candidatus Margulisiibacteriota bacterium]